MRSRSSKEAHLPLELAPVGAKDEADIEARCVYGRLAHPQLYINRPRRCKTVGGELDALVDQ